MFSSRYSSRASEAGRKRRSTGSSEENKLVRAGSRQVKNIGREEDVEYSAMNAEVRDTLRENLAKLSTSWESGVPIGEMVENKCYRCGHSRKSKSRCGSEYHNLTEKSGLLLYKLIGEKMFKLEEKEKLILESQVMLEEIEAKQRLWRARGGMGSGGVGPVPQQIVRKELRKYEKEIGIGKFSMAALQSTLETVSEMPNVASKHNLFFITMPSGSGKTYLSGKYGFIDIDSCIGTYERNYISIAISICHSQDDDVKEKYKSWLTCIRGVFKGMSFGSPTLVLVHDDMTGYLTGGRKIGGANVCLEEKIRRNKSRDKDRRKLIEVNDSIHLKMSEGDPEFRLHSEAEEYVLKRCEKFNIRHAGVSSQKDMTTERLDDMSMRQLSNAFEAGNVSKAYIDRRVLDDRECDTRGFGVTLNTWAMAMAGAYYGTADAGELDVSLSMADFSDNVSTSGQIDINRIVRLDIADDDKMRRLLWWIGIGRYMKLSNLMFDVITGIGRSGGKSFRGIGNLVSRSRFIFDTPATDDDRVDVIGLCRLYGYSGNTMLFEEDRLEDQDRKDIVQRHSKKVSGKYLNEGQTALAANVAGMEIYPSKMTVEEVNTSFVSWSTRDVMALFEMLRKQGCALGLGDGANLNDVAQMMMHDELNKLEEVDWSDSFISMLESSCDKHPGMGAIILERGIDYVIRKGRRHKTVIINAELENFIVYGVYNGESGTPMAELADALLVKTTKVETWAEGVSEALERGQTGHVEERMGGEIMKRSYHQSEYN